MPTHVYQPLRNPPRWVDRIMVHPWDNTIGLLSLVFGLLLGVALWYTGGIVAGGRYAGDTWTDPATFA